MSSKEEKKTKKESSSTTATPTKAQPAESGAETKTKMKKDRSSKVSLGQGAPTVVVDHSGLIDKKHADISLHVEAEAINVHKAIIDVRNKALLDGLVAKKNKKGTSGYDIKDIEFGILKRVVHWLYSDKIDLTTISLPDTVKVIKAATHYGLDRLSQICEQHLQKSLNLDNACDLLALSHALSVEKAKKIAFEFAFTHHNEMLQDPRFRKLDVNLIVDESILYSNHRAQLEAGWLPEQVEVTAPSTIVEDFKTLYNSMAGADLTIVVEKQNIKCHKAILGHASPKLMELTDQKDPVSMPKEFKSVTAGTFSDLLRYLYYGNTDIAPMQATQLIAFAKQLGLQTLVDICEAKIRHGIDKTTCLSILEVAYHPLLKDREDLQKELKTNCRLFFIDHIREIQVEPLRDMDSAIGADLLAAVQKQIGTTWTINESSSQAPSARASSSINLDAQTQSARLSTSVEKSESAAAEKETVEESLSKSETKTDKSEKAEATDAAATTDSAPATPAAATAAVAEEEAKSAEEESSKHEEEAPMTPSSKDKLTRQESKRDKKDKKEDKDKKDKKEEKHKEEKHKEEKHKEEKHKEEEKKHKDEDKKEKEKKDKKDKKDKK